MKRQDITTGIVMDCCRAAQVVQRPDEATVAFAYEIAEELPQGTIRPHSSL